MLSIHLDPDIELRLDRLAELTGRSKVSVVQEAIREYLQDLEDVNIAEERLKNPGPTYSSEEVKRELDL